MVGLRQIAGTSARLPIASLTRTAGVLAIVALGIVVSDCKSKHGESSDSPGVPTASAATLATEGSIGIAPCDQYIAKIETCFTKDPATKAAREQRFNRMTEGWKKVSATNPDAVRFSCKTALDNLGTTMPTCK